ncbi:hypothetical protein BgiBS90_019335 [Biomphalaria glabrata]|nr:hypothetical protein BgiBS90_019335 [Biomphalaria glabrata]
MPIFLDYALSYHHILMEEDETYYTSNCTLSIASPEITKDIIVLASVFPSVTGNISDIQWAFNFTVNVNIERCCGIQLVDCPVFVQEGQTINCTCQLPSNTQTVFNVQWSTGLNRSLPNFTETISFTAKRPSIDYTCIAKLHKKSFSVNYQPVVLTSSYNMTCGKEYDQNNQITITCTSERVYPKVKCHFVFSPANLSHIEKYISYHHEKTNVDPEYFTSQCSIKVENVSTTDCLHNVTVYMYPDLNTTVDARNYSTSSTIYLCEDGELSQRLWSNHWRLQKSHY